MEIILYPPLVMHERGRRDNNEDCVYPVEGLEYNLEKRHHLFLVCDGVGGKAKGEIASQITCTVFAKLLDDLTIVSGLKIEQALRETEKAIDDYIEEHPDAKGMATTMTLLSLHKEGATVAHIGDSRIYQLRNGEIIYKTVDHSLVQELLDNKIITVEQARNHPKRNVVTRAIMGAENATTVDVDYLSSLNVDDYFFMCTDGISESISDEELECILKQNERSDSDKFEEIRKICLANSRDNFSAYLLKIKELKEEELSTHLLEKEVQKGDKRFSFLLSFAALFVVAAFVLLNAKSQEKRSSTDQKNTQFDASSMLQHEKQSAPVFTDSSLMTLEDSLKNNAPVKEMTDKSFEELISIVDSISDENELESRADSSKLRQAQDSIINTRGSQQPDLNR